MFAAGSVQHGYYLAFTVAAIDGSGVGDPAFDDDGVVVESDCRRVPLTDPDCVPAYNASFSLQADGQRNRLSGKWRGVDSGLTDGDLGQPSTGTQYSICVYDTTAGSPTLASWISFPSANWQERTPAKGWRYNGLRSFAYGRISGVLDLLAEVGDGRPKFRFRSGLPNDYLVLSMPAPYGPTEFFNQDSTVVVQLVSSDGLCALSEFGVDATRTNDGERFAAKIH